MHNYTPAGIHGHLNTSSLLADTQNSVFIKLLSTFNGFRIFILKVEQIFLLHQKKIISKLPKRLGTFKSCVTCDEKFPQLTKYDVDLFNYAKAS